MPVCSDVVGDGLSGFAACRDDDVRVLLRQRRGDAAADPASRSGDQHSVTSQAHGNITEPPSMMMVSPTRWLRSRLSKNVAVLTMLSMRVPSSWTAAAVK